MPKLRSRIERLEAIAPQFPFPAVRIIQELGETEAACIRRHYGEAGAPTDRLLIIRVIV